MRYRQIGRGADAVRVSAIGLGEMPLSLRGRPDESQALRTIHAALDAGMTLAWMLAKGEHVIPIPGSSRPGTAQASAVAADIELTAAEVARLDAS